eukprot:jgi/Bigna1/67724/fgenesh1_pg.4_\
MLVSRLLSMISLSELPVGRRLTDLSGWARRKSSKEAGAKEEKEEEEEEEEEERGWEALVATVTEEGLQLDTKRANFGLIDDSEGHPIAAYEGKALPIESRDEMGKRPNAQPSPSFGLEERKTVSDEMDFLYSLRITGYLDPQSLVARNDPTIALLRAFISVRPAKSSNQKETETMISGDVSIRVNQLLFCHKYVFRIYIHRATYLAQRDTGNGQVYVTAQNGADDINKVSRRSSSVSYLKPDFYQKL